MLDPETDPSAVLSNSTVVQTCPTYDFIPFTESFSLEDPSAQTPQILSMDFFTLRPRGSLVVPDQEKWHVSNEAFWYGIEKGNQKAANSDIINSHMPYAAILWDWDISQESLYAHPVWTALRRVDKTVFGNWQSKAQKIAMMFVYHKMLLVSHFNDLINGPYLPTVLQYKLNPSKENFENLPTFFRPRYVTYF